MSNGQPDSTDLLRMELQDRWHEVEYLRNEVHALRDTVARHAALLEDLVRALPERQAAKLPGWEPFGFDLASEDPLPVQREQWTEQQLKRLWEAVGRG